MAINWFEGGRRISQLFIGLTVASGLAYVAFAATPSVMFSTAAPDEPWQLSTKKCEYPSAEKYLHHFDFGDGDSRSVKLCFEASIKEKIPYASAPEPDAPPSVITPRTDGPPPIIRTGSVQKWYYLGSGFDDAVEAYIDKRTAEFELTPERQNQARASLRSAYWQSRYNALSEALPFVGGISLFIWLFTIVTGWIIRGFAGVPSGKDFKNSASS